MLASLPNSSYAAVSCSVGNERDRVCLSFHSFPKAFSEWIIGELRSSHTTQSETGLEFKREWREFETSNFAMFYIINFNLLNLKVEGHIVL